MVAPTGVRPTTFVRNRINGILVTFEVNAKHWQKSPYTLPLDFDRQNGDHNQDNFDSTTYLASAPFDAETCMFQHFNSAFRTQAFNQAYERFKGKVMDSAALGVDFAEARQSISMIASTGGSLLKAARQIRRLDFLGAVKTLRMKFIPPGVHPRKSFANNWLEYHFGWEPLIKDVYDSIDVLNNPIKTFEGAKGHGSVFDSALVHTNFGSTFREYFWKRAYLCGQGGQVEALTSGTLHSLDQFGVNNPASILWELVPFSFVVDWFANVGQVLASYSDFAGMTLKNTYNSQKNVLSLHGFTGVNPGFDPGALKPMRFWTTGVAVSRRIGLLSPTFNVNKLRLPSAVRATTAIALLTQFMGKNSGGWVDLDQHGNRV